MANRKGERRERELVNRLDDAGFAVMRAPASGSATDRDLPDVLAGNGAQFYAIEAKSSSGNPIYLDETEVNALGFSRPISAPSRGSAFGSMNSRGRSSIPTISIERMGATTG